MILGIIEHFQTCHQRKVNALILSIIFIFNINPIANINPIILYELTISANFFR